ncbi:hypothetical protein M2336_001514 [Sphingobium sp. B1D7B]|uniref:hypothetical protein n=1 Tax=Sphingobium sp. B1D7B TaxID=2940578 RepID=UPI0039B5863D|nr:hypothetical protein [Sphingobium sp. B1D7B]
MWDIVKDASGLRANNIVGFLQINLSCPQARAHIGYRLEPTRSVSDVYPVEPSPFGVGMYAERAYLCKEGRDDFLTEAQMCSACVDQSINVSFPPATRQRQGCPQHRRAKDNQINVSGFRPGNGTAAEEAAGDYSAAPIEIGFSARYLLDILGQV